MADDPYADTRHSAPRTDVPRGELSEPGDPSAAPHREGRSAWGWLLAAVLVLAIGWMIWEALDRDSASPSGNEAIPAAATEEPAPPQAVAPAPAPVAD